MHTYIYTYMQYITLIWLITYIALHDITLHYITLHYIISHSIVLHYIISHYITDTKHTLISACVCSSECMYVCAFFDGARQSHDRMSGFPERHVFLFQSVMSSSSECSAASPQHRVRRARYEERTERLAQVAGLFSR